MGIPSHRTSIITNKKGMSTPTYKILLLSLLPCLFQGVKAQTSSQNYIEKVLYLNANRTDSIIQVQYYDGLGRPTLNVMGGCNTSNRYLYSLQEYDLSGRADVVWSPIAGSASPDFISPDIFKSNSRNFYDNDNKAYSRTDYDALDRSVFVSTPGTPWVGKGNSNAYRSNAQDEVRRYTTATLRNAPNYAQNTLYCVDTENEEGVKTSTFTDFLGRTILVRQGQGNNSLDTYYVYNDLGQLAYVLPPKYNANYNSDNDALNKYAFQYTYNSRGLVATKKLPGCAAVSYWYDNADRLIKMQDDVLAQAGKYREYAYDMVGRLTSQSITNGTTTEDEIINYYDGYGFIYQYPSQNLVCSGDSILGLSYGNGRYSNNRKYGQAQLTGIMQKASNGETILTTYIYDEYGRVVKQAEVGLGKNAIVREFSYNFLGNETLQTTHYYTYNEGSRALSGSVVSTITNSYNSPHTSLLTSTSIEIQDIAHNLTKTDVVQTLGYDNFGRVTSNDRGGNKADMSYEYDALHGWIRKVHSAGGFVQNLYYEDGADAPRFDGVITAMDWKNTSSDQIKRYDYTYDGFRRLTAGDYREPSSYSAMMLADGDGQNSGTEEGMYGLIPASSTASGTNKYGESYEYDENSNITGLLRYGMRNNRSFGLIDDLTIDYTGNQLKSVIDGVSESLNYTGASDFSDGSSRPIEYNYDANGHLVKDYNKGLNYSYDKLGHPLRVWNTDDTKSIEYVYAPDGRRLRACHTMQVGAASVKDYWGDLIVLNGEIERINFQGGYYAYDNAHNRYDRCYYVQDYQGNIRMTVRKKDGSSEQTEDITDYYPYGNPHMASSGYRYGGKELDRSYGLDLYDFEARQYDAIVPGFTAGDPMAEKYYNISPYVYCAGDPVNSIDQHGDSVCPLLCPDGAGYMGHAAILIQDESGKWRLYSKNGSTGSSGSYGPSGKDDEGDVAYNSPEEFINSTDNKKGNGVDVEYTEGIIIPCSQENDKKASEAAKKELDKKYYLFGSNCIKTVQCALDAAGLDDGSNPWTTRVIYALSSIAGFGYSKIPNDIYRRIKKNNSGTIIKVKK